MGSHRLFKKEKPNVKVILRKPFSDKYERKIKKVLVELETYLEGDELFKSNFLFKISYLPNYFIKPVFLRFWENLKIAICD